MGAEDCAKELLASVGACQKQNGLAAEEMGAAVLPSPSQRGCGAAYDPALLEGVDMRARAGQFMDTPNCAALAAQFICGIDGLPALKGAPALQVPAFHGDQAGRHECFCSIISACGAQVQGQF